MRTALCGDEIIAIGMFTDRADESGQTPHRAVSAAAKRARVLG